MQKQQQYTSMRSNHHQVYMTKYNVDSKQAESELFEYIQRRHRTVDDVTDKLDAIVQRMTRAMQCRQQVLTWHASCCPQHIRFSEDSD
jgi:hypothetical protein